MSKCVERYCFFVVGILWLRRGMSQRAGKRKQSKKGIEYIFPYRQVLALRGRPKADQENFLELVLVAGICTLNYLAVSCNCFCKLIFSKGEELFVFFSCLFVLLGCFCYCLSLVPSQKGISKCLPPGVSHVVWTVNLLMTSC